MPISNAIKPGGSDRGPFVTTFSGVRFYPFDPRPGEINLVDISQALSMKCRYTGHCARFYSVAQHSVLVAALVPEEFRKEALLHDAGEAYLADLAYPLKRHERMSGFQKTERELLQTVFERFGIPNNDGELSPVVEWADRIAGDLEWAELMHSEAVTLGSIRVLHPASPMPDTSGARRIPLLTPTDARTQFLQACSEVGLT